MNKGDLVKALIGVVGKKKVAEDAVACVFDSITGALGKGETASFVGFGTFKVRRRPAKAGRNPRTGSPIKIQAKKVPKFVPGKKLRDAVA